MIHASKPWIAELLALFETLFDIIRLKKGPDAIPSSSVLLVVIIALWLFAGVVMTIMSPDLDQQDLLLSLFTGLAGLACYAAVVVLAGRGPRLLQATMAFLGCGAIIGFLFVAANVFLSPFLSENLTGIIATLILLWSVPVEGHIISRTIDRHWYLGVVIAMAVFIFQVWLYSAIDPTGTP